MERRQDLSPKTKKKKIQRHTLFYSIDWEIEVPIDRFIRSSSILFIGNTSVSFHVVLMDVSLSISPRIQELFCDLGLKHIVVLCGIANSQFQAMGRIKQS